MLNTHKVIILHNIISPYKTLLFNELYELNTEIKVLYMAETESNREWEIEKNGLKFPHEVMFQGSLGDVSILKCVAETWKRLSHLDPSILILGGYSHVAYWVGFFWAKLNRKKIILWSSSNDDNKKRNFIKEKIKSIIVCGSMAANAYGQKSHDYLVALGMNPDNIAITGNTTDNEFYHVSAQSLRNKKEQLCNEYCVSQKNFLYVGRLSPEKNILHLLDSFRRLKNEGSDWGLIIVGSGPQESEIKDYVNAKGIKDVYLQGFKQKHEIPVYYVASDVFILPSTYETWGLVVNEAMASGLPILVSRKCGCYPDLIREGENGFSFDPFDKDELFSYMKNIANNRHDLVAMSKISYNLISNITPNNAAQIISKTIETVCDQKWPD